MDAPWPGPWLALGLIFVASAEALATKSLAGPWPGPGWPLAWPWLALGVALGWPLAWPLAGPVKTGSGSNQFRFRPVRFKRFWFDSQPSWKGLEIKVVDLALRL